MAISKVILDGSTLLDVTNSTVNAQRILQGYVAKGADGVDVTGSYVPQTSTDYIVTVTYNAQTEMWEPDRTYAEVSAAYTAGKTIVVDAAGPSVDATADGEWDAYGNHLEYWVHQYYEGAVSSVIETQYRLTSNGLIVQGTTQYVVPSGTLSITSSGTKDVTNYASASVAAGGATASATKGAVSNHSIAVTPSVTRTAGYVTAGTADGTAVTVSASELVSGSQTITDNGTVDVTNLASVDVAVESSGGNHKVTVSTLSASVNCRVKLNGAGTSYYKDGAEFEFSAGDYIQAYAMGSMGSGEIYVNGVRVAGGQDGATYNYALPPCNVAVSTEYSTTGRVYITTEEPLVVFENGEFTPSEDVTEVSVSFASSHLQPPTIVMVGDVQSSTSSTSTIENFVFVDEYRLFGGTGRFGTSTAAQGIAGGMYSNTTNSLVSKWNRIVYGSASASATDSTYSRWWASTTGFKAYLEASRYFRAGRKYAWTAIWTS